MSVIAPLNPVERAAATKATADKFRGRPLDFANGVTCIHLLREQMLAFGYSPPEIPQFTTVIGAKRALRKLGHRTLWELLDQLLPRAPGAQMRVGDIVLGAGQPPFEALGICAGGKILGFHEDGSGLVNIVPAVPFEHCWRLL